VADDVRREAVVLSEQEAAELYRYTKNDYISPNTYPHLCKLIARLDRYVCQQLPRAHV
jgi:hypothetical protein